MTDVFELTGGVQLKADGAALSESVADSVIDVTVRSTVGAAAMASVRCDDVDTAGATLKIGTALSITGSSFSGTSDTIFDGVITAVGVEVVPGRTELIVEALDRSYKLGQSSVSFSHLNKSAKDLVAGIASDAGLTSEVATEIGTVAVDYVQQTGTPHQFLDDLTHRAGCEWFVDGSKLVVRRRTPSTPIEIESDDLVSFSARVSAVEETTSVTHRGWDPASKQEIVGTESGINSITNPLTDVRAVAAGLGKLDAGAATSFSHPVPSVNAAKIVAKGTLGRMASSVLTGRGEVWGKPELKPGVTVDIQDVNPEWDGKYYVTEVIHRMGADQPYLTEFRLGELDPTSLVDLFGRGNAVTSQTRLATGLTIGIVTNVRDEEGLCRVKVKLPYIDDASESGWARVVQQGAGSGRGWIAMPEPDDEVVVAFEHGDLRRPLVLGGLWNGSDKPPIADMGANGSIGSRSFTTRTGHELFFSDGEGDNELYVSVKTSNGKTKLHLGQDRIDIHATDKPIEIKTKDAQINLTEQGALTLKAKNITLDAQQAINLKGSQISIKAQSSAKIEGATIDVKAQGKLSADGGGMAEIKGGMVKVN